MPCITAPNCSMSRLVSPSQGSVNNFGLNCFKIHANIGRTSEGNIATKCSCKHLYVDSNVVFWFTYFLPQNCLPITANGFTHSSSSLCILWNLFTHFQFGRWKAIRQKNECLAQVIANPIVF